MQSSKKLTGKYRKIILGILGIFVIGLQFKFIFTELNIDTEYAMAMSWRMLEGDFMLENMWEPHQTSAFLLAFIMKIYTAVTGTKEGIVVFVNAVGALIHCLIAVFIYYGLKRRIEPFTLKLLCMLFMTLHPKGFVAVTPEFTNMQVWFSIMLFLSLIRYYDDQRRKGWLVLASLFLCLEILSFPSCIIVYVFVLGLLFKFSERKWKDILIFSICCVLQGSAYLIFLICKIGISGLVENLGYILSGDSFHTQGGNVFGGLLSGMKETVLWLGGCFVLSYILKKSYQYFRKNRRLPMSKEQSSAWGFCIFTIVVFCTEIILSILLWYNGYDRTRFNIFLIILILYSCKGMRYLNESEKKLAIFAYVIAFSSVLSVCMLTNLSFTYSAGYTALAVIIAFIPLMRLLQQQKILEGIYLYGFLILTVCLCLFRGYIDIREVEGIIKMGPAKGIVTDYMNADKNNRNAQDWEQYVNEGDCVLIVGQYSINALGYLLGDTAVSAHSTMCNPTYNETLLEYWERNPEKYPDVIAVEAQNGNLCVDENSWIMQWIFTEYQPEVYVDGTYYRFYRLVDK